MRKILFAACVLAFGAATPEQDAAAAPASGAPIVDVLKSTSMVQQARVYCYNRYTGRFLHWGSCYRPVRRYPRVYCYNRYTGRFLHWGSCWR